jgi:DNA (cytosine-5)-methyltransferase 1
LYSEHLHPSAVDIFCGCGGLSEGFKQAGFNILLGIDNDRWAVKTFNKYHSGRGRLMNVEDVNANFIFHEANNEEIDVLIGGPPCQAFSHIAVAKWKSIGTPPTVTHPLNTLYREFLRLVLDVSPKFFVIENVERMLSIEEGVIKKHIEFYLKRKYAVSFYVKDAADFGVPQHRRRVLVIGNRLGLDNPVLEGTCSDVDTTKNRYVTVRDAISDLPIIKHNGGKEYFKYRKPRGLSDYATERRKKSIGIFSHISRPHNKRDLKIFRMLEPGQNLKHLPRHFNPYRHDVFGDKYKKQPWNSPSSTILAHLSKDGLMFIHPDKRQNRTLTPREAARLQSFDDRYTFEGSKTVQYIQIGNAVPPLFARSIAAEISNILRRSPACKLILQVIKKRN